MSHGRHLGHPGDSGGSSVNSIIHPPTRLGAIMYPWLWFWAPQIHFPWSGSVAQNIEPNTTWFSDLIKPDAGNARIEQQAFGVASYGTQLGLITDVLLELSKTGTLPDKAAQALEELRRISSRIDTIKRDERESASRQLEAGVRSARNHGGQEYEELKQRLLALLNEPAGSNRASAS
jgi:hypothetical protein